MSRREHFISLPSMNVDLQPLLSFHYITSEEKKVVKSYLSNKIPSLHVANDDYDEVHLTYCVFYDDP